MRIFNPHQALPIGQQLIPKTLIEEAIKKGTDKYLEPGDGSQRNP